MSITPDEKPSDEEAYEPVLDEESPATQPGEERDDVPNPETGVGLTMGEESSFEPEEDPEAAGAGEPGGSASSS